MVPKKEKIKRKRKLKEDNDENTSDKYLAYVIKPKKKKIAMEFASEASTSKVNPSVEKQKLKKKKVKKQKENLVSELTSQNDSESTATVSISAKPKLYKDTNPSKASKKKKIKKQTINLVSESIATMSISAKPKLYLDARHSKATKKKKVKKHTGNFISELINEDDSESITTMSISAKPKLYTDASSSKATYSTSKKTSKVKKKGKSVNQVTLNDSLANWTVDDATGIKMITPKVSMEPRDKYGNVIPMVYPIPRKFEYDIEYEKDMSDYDMKAVVIEAHLTKPSSYYTPRVLKDFDNFQSKLASMNQQNIDRANESSDTSADSGEDSCVVLEVDPKTGKVKSSSTASFNSKSSKKSKNAKKSKTELTQTSNVGQNIKDALKESSDRSNNIESSNSESNETSSIRQDANAQDTLKKSSDKSNEVENTESIEISNTGLDSNIPDALKEFYEEVTKGFENLANKSSHVDKKSKKKSSLTVDKSVTDERTLASIVSRNTAQLENTVSTYQQDIAKFFSLENKVILVLNPQAQFSFLGKLKIRVLYGAIELYGSLLNSQNTSKPIEVYSPRGYSSISISTSNTNGVYDKEALWDYLTAEGVDRSLKTKLHDCIQECKDGWSVLLLETFENTLTNFLNSYCSFKLFPKIDNIRYSWCDPKRAECILQAYFQFTCSTDEISICPQWNDNVTKQLLEQWQLTKSMTTVVTGGKGVGKSTTARYLINNLLRYSEKVVLLDLDIGQTEMTPPGSVSLSVIEEPLLGPNFTHLKMPYCQFYLEDVSVTNCLSRYIEGAKKLVECLKNKDLQKYPVIVNTMGFCKGIGLDICIFLIKLIQPSNVVQIMSKRPKNNFEFALLKQTINEYKTSSISLGNDNAIFEKNCDYELHYVPSTAEGKRQFETWNMEPRQQRELVLLSYLSQIISNTDDKNFCNFTSNSINNIVPYTLPFSSFYITLIKSNISPTHILAAMNGNIVALCGADLDDETSEEDKEALNFPMVVIKAPSCTCYGYGIVRGIDMKRREVYINTPLKESELRHVNLLAGCTPVPFSLLHRDAPYAGGRGELPTSREPRRGNFRVDQSRKS